MLFLFSAGKHIVVENLSNPYPPMLHFYYGTPLFLLFGRMLLFDGGERRRKRMGKVVHSLSPPPPAAVCNQEDAADAPGGVKIGGGGGGGQDFSWLHPTHPFPPSSFVATEYGRRRVVVLA